MKQKPKWTLSSFEPFCVTIKNNAVLGFYKTIFDFFLIFSLDTIRSESRGDLGEGAGGAPLPSPPWYDLRLSNTISILQKNHRGLLVLK